MRDDETIILIIAWVMCFDGYESGDTATGS